MSISIYKASVASFQKHLHALDGILDKAASYADEKKIDPAVLLSARLYPDMFTMKKQVQEACTFASSATARLAGIEIPSSDGDDTTIADLKARIAKTQTFLAAIKPEQLDGAAEKVVKIKVGPNEMTFSGEDYLLHFALPNFYFHCATAYGNLRHNGLAIGKRDFMRRV
ncbi:MAG: DUF1993 domain-containing protein [Hyphomicrobium sp.]